ncbi:hypothetical protein MNEG_16193, partial [Monoraphidium neglectum]
FAARCSSARGQASLLPGRRPPCGSRASLTSARCAAALPWRAPRPSAPYSRVRGGRRHGRSEPLKRRPRVAGCACTAV